MADVEAIKAKLKEAFDAVDEDGDGQISHDDLKACLVNAGLTPTDEQIQQLIALSDADGSGSVGFEEFATAIVSLGIKIRIVMILRKAFEAIDTDGTGTLSAENIREVLDANGVGEHVSDDQINDFIAKADTTGDGQVSWRELLELIAASE